MSTSGVVITNSRVVPWIARVADYVELTKPRIAAMVLVSVAVSAFVGSWGPPNGWLLVNTLVGTALIAGSASALNQWLERESDARMTRTVDRPLPAGRLTSAEVLLFGATMVIFGLSYLALIVNVSSALFGLVIWALYVWVYTPLKSRTAANTMIGAIAGAMPVLLGWAAVGGSFDPRSGGLQAATLFLIVFLWQFPHFMAIAWIYRSEYASANMKMLTVVDPTGHRAGAQAVMSAMLLLPVSLLPAALHVAGPIYFALALGLGSFYLAWSIMFFGRRDEATARGLLRASLLYLPLVLGLFMLVPLV